MSLGSNTKPTSAQTDTSYRAIAKLTGPIFLANLALICSGTIDTMMAGRLSAAELAGVALGMAIAGWVSVSFSDILQGLSPVAGFYYGAKDYRSVGVSMRHSLYLALMLTVPGLLLIGMTDFWTEISGIEGDAAVVAAHYLLYYAAGLPAILLSRGYICVNAAVSRPKATMIVTVILLILKLPFNAVFMYGWGPVPALGGAGAGLSTTLLSWIGLLFYWLIWTRDPYYAPMRTELWVPFDKKIFKSLLKVGLPIGVAGCCEMTAFSAMTLLLARLGDVVVAAHQVLSNLVYLLYVCPFSVGIAGTILVSQSMGAKYPEGAKAATYRVLKVALVSSLLLAAAVYVGRYAIVRLYADDADVVAVAVSVVALASIYHIVDGLQISATSLLRGYQITFWPMMIHAIMLCGMGLSVGSVLAYTDWFTEPMGLKGYWVGACVGLGLVALMIVPLAIHTARLKVKKP